MKVKIIKCSKVSYWYKKYINKIFNVKCLKLNSNKIYYVDKKDIRTYGYYLSYIDEKDFIII